jgi:aryl-alcohol dehydrogenase-like predicted oxidoreductase
MERRRLGPVVGLGTWNTFGGDARLAADVVGAALESGCELFDTSPMYSPGAFGELAAALESRRFDSVQLPLNPLQRECERNLLPLADELGIAVVAMRPFGEGRLLHRPPRVDALAPLGTSGVETWPQGLLEWALSDKRVDVVIPATKSSAHLRENARAGEPPWLGPEERGYVERLAAA